MMHRGTSRSRAPRGRGRGFGVALGQDGLTLVELLIVLVVLGVLTAVALPSYLGMQARAADTAAKRNIHAARVAAEAFARDNAGVKGDADGKAGTRGYKGMTAKLLRTKYDAGLSPTLVVVTGKTTQTAYCLTDKVDGRSWSALGPGGGETFMKNAKCK